MNRDLQISNIHFTASDEGTVRTGLLGWVSLVVGGVLRLDGLTLRRTADGRITLAFPERRDVYGLRHEIVRPVDDAVRREIEEAVFQALGIKEALRS